MRVIADLHIHSRYSRACSKDLTLPNIAKWCAKKGIGLVGTGDFTHPAWFAGMQKELEPHESGFYKLTTYNLQLTTLFVPTAEISCIYKRGGKVRRVHHIVVAPTLEVVKKINTKLASIGNIHSDGRPILGLDSEELAKIVFAASPDCLLIPAHAWTPWFAVFGSESGFDSLEECFGSMTKYIYAIETGLSCYDIKTEVLTEEGWKPFSHVAYTDKICTLNLDTEEIEYQSPQKIYQSKYRGKMYQLKTKRADLLVTPNHHLLYAPADFHTRRPYRLKEARDLFRKSKILRKDGIWEGATPQYFTLPEVKIQHGSRFYSGFRTKAVKKFSIKSWLTFFGFWIAEGWTTEGKNGHYAVCISNQNHTLMTGMKRILESFGYTVFWDKKITNTIRVRDYQLFHYLQQFGKASDKYIPIEVKSLSKELLGIFFKYYIKGDGHVYGRSEKGLSATTISTRLRDDLQELALKLGISAYYKLHQKKGTLFSSPSQKKEYRQSADSWNIYFVRRNRHSIIPSTMKKNKYKEEWVDYNGLVYCVSVPNRVVYIRRNGIPLWCGNSDPSMNWRLSQLDRIALLSNSDAHSLQNLGREANVFDLSELSYKSFCNAIRTKDQKRFLHTIEFFPEEGKYHVDGHRACGVRFKPEETKRRKGVCPQCQKPVTVGVLYRIDALADRKEGEQPQGAIPYKSIVPLQEIIAEALGVGKQSKKVQAIYERMVAEHSEFAILLDVPYDALGAIAGDCRIVEGIRRVREGKLTILPGYDGEYGTIRIFSDEERVENKQQKLL